MLQPLTSKFFNTCNSYIKYDKRNISAKTAAYKLICPPQKNIMFKKISVLAVVLFTNYVSSAQSRFSLGPQAGFGISTVSNINNSSFKPAGNVGLSLVYSVVEHFGLGADLKYSFEGGKAENNTMEATYNLDYVRIPLKAIFFFNDFGDRLRPKIAVGPSIGFLTRGQRSFNNSNPVDIKSSLNTTDFGLHAGAGLHYRLVKNTWFNTDLTYQHGLNDVNKSINWKNRNVQLNVGVNFGL